MTLRLKLLGWRDAYQCAPSSPRATDSLHRSGRASLAIDQRRLAEHTFFTRPTILAFEEREVAIAVLRLRRDDVLFVRIEEHESASVPTAIVPFRGNRPNSFAGAVEVISTKRFSESRCRARRRRKSPSSGLDAGHAIGDLREIVAALAASA